MPRGGPARITGTNVLMGTPDYMAPEQRERARDVDHRADLYSLGVVLYEMLTGELPIGRFGSPSQRRPEVDVRLDAVVLRVLDKDPERRYQRASEISDEVERIARAPAPAQDLDGPATRAVAAGAGRGTVRPLSTLALVSLLAGLVALLAPICLCGVAALGSLRVAPRTGSAPPPIPVGPGGGGSGR